jgi:hypothetical protein
MTITPVFFTLLLFSKYDPAMFASISLLGGNQPMAIL